MAIEKMTENVEIVQTLSTYPNQEEGLSAEELKAKFDQGSKTIKDFLNNVLIPAVNEGLGNMVRAVEVNEIPIGHMVYFDFIKDGESTTESITVTNGQDGADGFSPQVRVGNIDGGHRVSITYKDDERDNEITSVTFDVMDGNTPELDDTLSVPGRAADAAAVGEALKKLPAAGDVVKHTPQELTEKQKAQARENIGAAPYGSLVLKESENDPTGSIVSVEVLAPITDETGDPIMGRVAFYETHHDGECQLVNIADGTEKNHAATLGQVVQPYYHTERKEIGVSHEEINSEYIWGLYDDLAEEYNEYKKNDNGEYEVDEKGEKIPILIRVQKNFIGEKDENGNPAKDENGNFVFENYEYVISTGEYPTDGLYAEHYGADEHIRKPKYLILSGIHGTERCAALSAYRFIRDVLAGHNVPKSFLESAVVHVLPVGTPSAIDLFTRKNGDGIDVNRDFDSEAPAKETQAIINWLSANSDAELYIDCHNNGAINEVVAIVGISDNDAVDVAKKLALQGVDKVIPFWRDVIGYPPVEAPYFDENGDKQVGIRDMVFSYCANFDVAGASISYALNALGIPGITVETSVYYGNYSDWVAAEKKTYPPETIAAGAEAYGNILLEIHRQSFFGEVSNDMKTIDNKLDALLASVNSGFRMESDVLHFDTDQGVGASSYKLTIPCTSGAKVITIRADDATFDIIKNQTSADDGNYWFIGACGNAIALVGSKSTFRSYMCQMNTLSSKWQPTEAGTTFDNEACTFATLGVKAGNYNWSAYYWND